MVNFSLDKYKILVATVLGVFLSLFHLYTGYFGLLLGIYQRSIHYSLILALCFLIFPATKNKKIKKYTDILDLFFVILPFLLGLYIMMEYFDLANRIGNANQMDIFLGTIIICLTLEAVRRTCGLPIVLVAVVFILLALLGPYLPLPLMHKGYSIARIAPYLYLTTEGIFGIPLGVAATYIILFVIFSELLKACGAGDFFMNLAYSITAWARGGPAKSAVVASAFFGTISGSAMTNVVTTGTFTIPLMIHTGYKKEFAAAVEATASTGGLIMPPVMGSAAFIMAEMLNLSYISICIAAIIPALLYYACIFFTVDLEAQKQNLKGISREKLMSFKDVLLSGYEYIIPIVVLVYFLVKQWSPATSVSVAMIVLLIMSFFRKKNRFTIETFFKALSNAAKMAIPVSSACAAAGIIMGIVSMTGLGLQFSSAIISLSGDVLIYGLVLTMIASIILGMGMPSSACYIILAVLAAPALIGMGVDRLAANFYIFYFGVLSNITPPVALAAYTAAGISGSNSIKVGVEAVKLGIVAFIVPFMFIYAPSLLFVGEPLLIIRTFITALIGCYAIAVAMAGWFYGPRNYLERFIWFLIGIGLIYPEIISDVISLTALAIIGIGEINIYKYKINAGAVKINSSKKIKKSSY